MKQLWTILLALKRKVAEYSGVLDYCCFNPKSVEPILINELPEKKPDQYVLVQKPSIELSHQSGTHFLLREYSETGLLGNQLLSQSEIDFLKIYLPYCFLSQVADEKKRTVSVAHFAQTLDGKIATDKGDSRWIGNEENLDHAHRMRALCDAILIGKHTLKNDFPKLTVRRVEGEHPKRVVLASPESNFSSLLDSHHDPIIVLGKEASTQNGRIFYHQLDAENGCIKSGDILECLYQQGIKTVYIEGGAFTTSNFVKDRSLDILQLHLSPCLFGSGKPAVILPGIDEVEEGIRFRNFSFHKIGDTIMFVGQPA